MWYAGRRMSRRRRGHSVDFVDRERDARARVCGSRSGGGVAGLLVPGDVGRVEEEVAVVVVVRCQRR